MTSAEVSCGDRVLFKAGRTLTPGVVESIDHEGGVAVVRRDGDGELFDRPLAALQPVVEAAQ